MSGQERIWACYYQVPLSGVPEVGAAQSSRQAKMVSQPQRQKQLFPDPQTTPEGSHHPANLKSAGGFSIL